MGVFAVDALGGLTSLVNCAGVLRGGAFGSPTVGMENYRKNFGINTGAVFEMTQLAVPHLKAATKGANAAIVNITSVNGKQSFAGTATYCASKVCAPGGRECASLHGAAFNSRAVPGPH